MIAVGPPKTARENYWSYLPGKSQKKGEEKLQLKYQGQGSSQPESQAEPKLKSGQLHKVQSRQPVQ